LLSFFIAGNFAQSTNQLLPTVVLAGESIPFKEQRPPRTLGQPQLSVCATFYMRFICQLMQASIFPRHYVMYAKYYARNRIYNKHQLFSPQGYGATSYTWSLEMKMANPHQYRKQNSWELQANEIPVCPGKLCTMAITTFLWKKPILFDAGIK